MTSQLLRKHPTTRPSILRSTPRRLFPLVVAALVLMPGCGVTQEFPSARHPGVPKERRNPRYDVLLKHKSEPPSRFVDIEQASFFDDPKAAKSPKVPLAPAPTPVNSEPTIRKSVPVHHDRVVTPAPAPLPVSGEPRITELVPVPEPLETAPAPAPAVEPALRITSCRPVPAEIQTTQYQADRSNTTQGTTTRPPVDDPRKLKKITEIQPYAYYEPDAQVRAEDPCRHLCPRPDGAPCELQEGVAHLCPEEVVLSNDLYVSRCFGEKVFAWEASNIHYNPLYFEDAALERYGHTYPCLVQPFASVGLFSVQLLGLPYQMSIDPVWKDIYPLGYYRPGECAPKLHYQIPWNTKAALTQAAVTTGMFYLIP